MFFLSKTMKVILLVVLIFCACHQIDGALQCKNPTGAAVDWWSMLKLPIITTAPTGSPARLGTAFVYLDSTAPNAWQSNAENSINGTNNALYQTLHPLYLSSSSSLGSLMYDDQDPTGTTHSSFGHTKGVWAFDSSTGFWLTHSVIFSSSFFLVAVSKINSFSLLSVPRFPSTDTYQYPDNEVNYGQSFLCVSLSLSTINNAAENLLFNKPYVFKSNLPTSLAASVPNVQSVLASKWITGAPYTRVFTISTLGGASWETFAKNAAWNNELWDALVAPTLKN